MILIYFNVIYVLYFFFSKNFFQLQEHQLSYLWVSLQLLTAEVNASLYGLFFHVASYDRHWGHSRTRFEVFAFGSCSLSFWFVCVRLLFFANNWFNNLYCNKLFYIKLQKVIDEQRKTERSLMFASVYLWYGFRIFFKILFIWFVCRNINQTWTEHEICSCSRTSLPFINLPSDQKWWSEQQKYSANSSEMRYALWSGSWFLLNLKNLCTFVTKF